MSSVIYKYPLAVEGVQRVAMPRGAKILSLQVQSGVPCIWALVDTEEVRVDQRQLRIVGTGHTFTDVNPRFLGTIQLQDGALAFHVFELVSS